MTAKNSGGPATTHPLDCISDEAASEEGLWTIDSEGRGDG